MGAESRQRADRDSVRRIHELKGGGGYLELEGDTQNLTSRWDVGTQRGQEPDVGGGQNLRARMWRVELTGSH